MAFTDKQIQRLKPGPTKRNITETGVPPDLRGLQLRISPTGSKAWVLRYKIDGKVRVLTLGHYPNVTLADAHRMVQEHRAVIRDGKDPAAIYKATAQANRDAPTVQMIFEEFRDHYLRKHRKRPKHAEDILENHVLKKWGKLTAADITRRQIIERVREIDAAGTPRVAEIVKLLTGQMYAYAVDHDLISVNPAARIPVIGSLGEKRERVLSNEEVAQLWTELDTAKMVPNLRIALRLLLVTGQRRQELALARWAEIDRGNAIWTIPAAHSKNGKAHQVPLSKLALNLLGQLDATETAFVIPSRLKEDRPVDPMALTRAVRNNIETEHFKIPAFTPHDLRRTVASGMGALGVQRFHISKVLNHADDSVTARYDRHDYLDEKRDALDLWGKHLQAIISGATTSPKNRKKPTPRKKPKKRKPRQQRTTR
jgi:integrase